MGVESVKRKRMVIVLRQGRPDPRGALWVIEPASDWIRNKSRIRNKLKTPASDRYGQ